MDGWMVFTNRVSWIENTQLILIVLALWAYVQAVKTESIRWFMIAGITVGAVIVFKHIGVYLLLALLINWMIQRRLHRDHGVLLVSVTTVGALYVLIMSLVYPEGGGFLSTSWAQFERMAYLKESRGTLVSFGDAIGALTDQYSIFLGTILVATAALVTMAWRIVQCITKRSWQSVRDNSLLFSFALAATVFFATMSLKMPHYFELLFIPLSLYLVSEAVNWWREGNKLNRTLLLIALGLTGIMSIGAFVGRVVVREDNALQQITSYAMTEMPLDAVVIADETVGAAIPQAYCKPERARACVQAATYIITYESHTQYLSRDATFQEMMKTATKVKTFVGFKETISIWIL